METCKVCGRELWTAGSGVNLNSLLCDSKVFYRKGEAACLRLGYDRATKRIEELEAALGEIKRPHRSAGADFFLYDDTEVCEMCEVLWPCPTIKIVQSVTNKGETQ